MSKYFLIFILLTLLSSCVKFIDYRESKGSLKIKACHYDISYGGGESRIEITVGKPSIKDSGIVCDKTVPDIQSVRLIILEKNDSLAYDGRSTSSNQFLRSYYFYDADLLKKINRKKNVFVKIIYLKDNQSQEEFHLLKRHKKRMIVIGRIGGC